MQIYEFNVDILIQCRYVHSMRIYSFNAEILIQYANILNSMQICLFNTNSVYSIILGIARPSHTMYRMRISAGNTSCKGRFPLKLQRSPDAIN